PYLRELPAGAAHPGQLTADGDAPAEWTEQIRIGFLDRDVVDQGGGPGTNAEDVVDVHGDAVDAHTVVAARGLRDQKLRPDAVRGDGDAERLAHRNHVGEVSNIEDWTRAGGKVKGRTDPAQECAQTAADRPYPDRVLGQRRHRSHPYRRVIAGSVGHRRRLSILLAHPRRERRSIAGQVETVKAGGCPLAIPGGDPGISICLRRALEPRRRPRDDGARAVHTAEWETDDIARAALCGGLTIPPARQPRPEVRRIEAEGVADVHKRIRPLRVIGREPFLHVLEQAL